jgi:hypothetical protein
LGEVAQTGAEASEGEGVMGYPYSLEEVRRALSDQGDPRRSDEGYVAIIHRLMNYDYKLTLQALGLWGRYDK